MPGQDEFGTIDYETSPRDARHQLWLVILGGTVGLLLFLTLAGVFARLLLPVATPKDISPASSMAAEAAATPRPNLPQTIEAELLSGPPKVISDPPDALFADQTSVATPPAVSSPVSGLPATQPVVPVTTPDPMAPVAASGPRLALVVTELGSDPQATRLAIQTLPAAVAMAFAPYGTSLQTLANEARADGHEVWLGLPMQPKSYPRIDPGVNALLLRLPPAELDRRLTWLLGRFKGYVGVYSMMGSAFTEDKAALDPVMARLATQQLKFLDARSTGQTIGPSVARSHGVTVAMNNRYVDETPSADAIARELKALTAQARANRSAIGFVSGKPASIQAVKAWLATPEAQGLTLTPVSELAH